MAKVQRGRPSMLLKALVFSGITVLCFYWSGLWLGAVERLRPKADKPTATSSPNDADFKFLYDENSQLKATTNPRLNQPPRRPIRPTRSRRFRIQTEQLIMWVGVTFFSVTFLASFGVFMYRRREITGWGGEKQQPEEESAWANLFKKDEKKKAKKKRSSPKKSSEQMDYELIEAESKLIRSNFKDIEKLTVTDQVKEQLTSIISGVKSLAPDIQVIEEDTQEMPINPEAFEDSEVVKAFIDDLVTEPTSEQTDIGKFSKMMVDASLVFDENDRAPDLDEEQMMQSDLFKKRRIPAGNDDRNS